MFTKNTSPIVVIEPDLDDRTLQNHEAESATALLSLGVTQPEANVQRNSPGLPTTSPSSPSEEEDNMTDTRKRRLSFISDDEEETTSSEAPTTPPSSLGRSPSKRSRKTKNFRLNTKHTSRRTGRGRLSAPSGSEAGALPPLPLALPTGRPLVPPPHMFLMKSSRQLGALNYQL